MNPVDEVFQAAREGNDQSQQNRAVLGKKGVLGCVAGGPGAMEAQQVKREQGALWGLVSGWRRTGRGKVIHSSPILRRMGPGLEGLPGLHVRFLGSVCCKDAVLH